MPAASSSIAPHSPFRIRTAALLIVAATIATYAPGMWAPAELAAPAMLPPFERPAASPASVFPRPLLTFASSLDLADMPAQRALRLGIHLAASLLLFGIVRRTLNQGIVSSRLRDASLPLAGVTALLWALHPLQTNLITATDRVGELIGGGLSLLSLYSLVRGADSPHASGRRWLVLAVATSVVGVTVEPVVVFVPLLLFLFDRALLAGSFRDAWALRRNFYLLSALTGLVFALLIASSAWPFSSSVPRHVSSWSLFFSQLEAMAIYLRLALWPASLVFDYGARFEADVRLMMTEAVAIGPLLLLTLHALVRRPAAGFLGAVFFLLLLPAAGLALLVHEPIAEHRMYLPLAAIAAALVLLAYRVSSRATFLLCGVVVIALAAATVARNRDYRSALALWSDTVDKLPDNARAHHHLGRALLAAGERNGAIQSLAQAIRLNPTSAGGHRDLAVALIAAQDIGDIQFAQARRHAEAAVRLNPNSPDAHLVLARVLLARGETNDALAQFEQVLKLDPHHCAASKAIESRLR